MKQRKTDKVYTNEDDFQKLQDALFKAETEKEAQSIIWEMKPLIEHACRSALKDRLKKLLWSGLITWDDLYEQADEMSLVFMSHLLCRWKKHSDKRVLKLLDYMYFYIQITNTESRKIGRKMTDAVYDEVLDNIDSYEPDLITEGEKLYAMENAF